MDIPPQLTHPLIALVDGGSIVAVVVGVAKAFEWFDGMVSDAGRQALSNQLKNAPSDERIDSWATVFPRLIDRIFGERALSWKFFFRSCMASYIAVLSLTFLYSRVHHQIFSLGSSAPIEAPTIIASVGATMLLASVMNVLPDYASLLVSRTIVRKMAIKPTASRILGFVILDTVLSIAVFYVGLRICVVILDFKFNPPFHWSSFYNSSVMSTGDLWDIFTLTDSIGVFLYSSLFTSVWVWLYVVSIFAIRLLHGVRTIWAKVTPYLDIEKKPLVAIGRVAGLFAGAGYAVLLGFIWIGRHWH